VYCSLAVFVLCAPLCWHILPALVTQFFTDVHHGHDDLLFLVLKRPGSGGGGSSSNSSAPFHVIRRAPQLPLPLHLSGTQFGDYVWADTVLLNLVLQADYTLTVTACR
jgi:hypothetical protein